MESENIKACNQFINSFASVLISSIDDKNRPHGSYAPFVRIEDKFYILISDLARHTRNLLNVPYAACTFIQEEGDVRNIYARERVMLDTAVSQVNREQEEYQVIIEQMEQKLGNTVSLLTSLSDFRLFELAPYHGSYVVGFAKAYDWDIEEGVMRHVDKDSLNSSSQN